MGISVVKSSTSPSGSVAESEDIEYALGPGSVTWRVLKDPTVFIVGLLREALLLTLHPAFAAAAVDHDSFGDDPVMRFKHVAWYTYAATYGTPKDAEHVSEIVRRRHKTIVGVEPLTQIPYRADAEYELALTQAMLSASFLAAYELLHGELTSAQRDQFFEEQKVPAALLGTHPDHLPATYGQMVDFIAHARNRFATGLQARETLSPFADGDYPTGTAIGDLPLPLRKPAMFVLRTFADMAMLTMSWEERELISINRRPKLGSKRATRAALTLLSRWFRGERGQAVFAKFLGEHIAPIYQRALAVDAAPGGRIRVAQFKVPDARACLVREDYLLTNWPGSPADYVLGWEARHAADQPEPPVAAVLHSPAASS
ncbi:oxygenase MpaB family protein [Mycolicibacterium litorale]|uniref:oxygenase MpaB family protein n=1 Tax=Mycolicibacterium litorale TaxID=758802 RepID=UPI003CE8B34C